MSTERISIVISEDGSRSVKRNLDDLGTAADKAAGSTETLQAEMKRLQGASAGAIPEVKRLGASAAEADEFAVGLAEGMREVLEEEIRLGRISRETAGELQRFAGATATGSQQVAAAATATQRGTSGLLEWKKEAGRSREAAQFLAQSLGTLGSGSTATGAAMRMMVLGMTGAGGMLIALEAVHAMVNLATSAYENWRQEQREAIQAGIQQRNTLADLARATTEYGQSLLPVGAGTARYRDVVKTVAPEVRRLKDQVEEMAGNLTVFDNYDKHAEKVRKIGDRVRELEAAARSYAAVQSALAEEDIRRQQLFAANRVIGQGVEANRAFGEDTLALKRKFAADEVRIREDAERQIRDLEANTALRSQGLTDARIAAIRAVAAEEKQRAQETLALSRFSTLQGYAGTGATPERQAWLSAETEMMRLGTEYDQAARTHNETRKREIAEQLTAFSNAADVKLALLDAETAKQRALATMEWNRIRLEDTEAQAMARADRYEIAKNLGAGGSIEGARRVAALENELDQERILLEEAAQEHPELRGQIELAETERVRRGERERTRIRMESGQGSMADEMLRSFDLLDARSTQWAEKSKAAMADFTKTFAGGFADASAHALVFQENLGDALGDMSRQALAGLVSGLIQMGEQMLINAVLGKSLGAAAVVSSAAQATAISTAWAPAALFAATATLGTAVADAEVSLASGVALTRAMAVGGFRAGGYTGDGPLDEVAGVVHRREVVMNAGATAQYRPVLEAMNRGDLGAASALGPAKASGTTLNVKVENTVSDRVSAEVTREGDEVRIRMIAREVVESHAPQVLAREVANPNSRFSTAQGRFTKTERRRT